MSSRQAMVRQVMQIGNVNNATAQNALQQSNWSIDRAVNYLYDNPGNAPRVDKKALEKIFDSYKDKASDKEVGINGTIKLVTDLGLAPEDPVVLAVCYHCNAPSQGVFVKDKFVDGWAALGVQSLSGMKKAVQDMKKKMSSDEEYFKKVYRFTFVFNLVDEGQRILHIDTAIPLWQLLLTNRYPQLDQWIKFVTDEYKKNISKDTWNMIWEFAKYHNSDPELKEYDEEGSWPTVIDDYVEWLKS